jgi:hypothetical protein
MVSLQICFGTIKQGKFMKIRCLFKGTTNISNILMKIATLLIKCFNPFMVPQIQCIALNFLLEAVFLNNTISVAYKYI